MYCVSYAVRNDPRFGCALRQYVAQRTPIARLILGVVGCHVMSFGDYL